MPTFLPDDAAAYKTLARAWAATVTVVTARRRNEPDTDLVASDLPLVDGFTATAFLTVSIEPPIVLVSVTNASSAAAVLRDAQGFVVNLLAPDQSEVAAGFARPQAERAALLERLACPVDADGAPLVPGAVGAFSARPREFVEAGDHVLVLGDVTAIHHSAALAGESFDSLVYHNRAYGRVRPQ